MLGVTIFGIFLTPVFFYVVRRITGRRTTAKQTPQPATGLETSAHVLPV
jgi:multidrug efflux pump